MIVGGHVSVFRIEEDLEGVVADIPVEKKILPDMARIDPLQYGGLDLCLGVFAPVFHDDDVQTITVSTEKFQAQPNDADVEVDKNNAKDLTAGPLNVRWRFFMNFGH